MAANFWTSSHARMLFSQEEVLASNPKDRELGLLPEQIGVIKATLVKYLSQLAQTLGAGKARQRVVATAAVYFRRFYLSNSFVEHDPRLVAPACLYLAAKAEESPIQARHLAQVMRKCRSDPTYWFEVKDLLAMELILLEQMAFCLSVFHPYRDVQKLLDDAGLGDDMVEAWSIVNDSYLTEVCLMHAPHVTAVACVYILGVMKNQTERMDEWLSTLSVDKDALTLVIAAVLEAYQGKGSATTTSEDCSRILNGIHAGSVHAAQMTTVSDESDRGHR